MSTIQTYHIPVLLAESLQALAVRPDGVYVDATMGGGGHFGEIVARLDNRGTAIGIDRDLDAINFTRAHIAHPAPKIIIEQSPFSQFDEVLKRHAITSIDGMLLDIGVSSHQIDEATRGFSYMQDGELDMRMDTSQGASAKDLIDSQDDAGLAEILAGYGEIRNPMRMARVLKKCSNDHESLSSHDVRACLTKEYGSNLPIKVIAKVFQSLRIAVNNELEELQQCLEKALSYVNEGGRIVVISYHSLEDRIVKTFIRDNEEPCRCPPVFPQCICGKVSLLKRINKKVIVPTDDEIRNNSRARSARLRCAERVNSVKKDFAQ